MDNCSISAVGIALLEELRAWITVAFLLLGLLYYEELRAWITVAFLLLGLLYYEELMSRPRHRIVLFP